MTTRASKTKTRHKNAQNGKGLSRSCSSRLNNETNSFMEDQVDKIFLRIQNKSTLKMRDEIRKSENSILKALTSLWED